MKIKKLKFWNIFLMLTFIFISCTQEQEQALPSQEDQLALSFYDKVSIENAELNEQLAYKNFHLIKLMEEVIGSNPDFDGQLTSKSSKGGHIGAAHFRGLLSKAQEGKEGTPKNDKIQFSLEAFLGLDGDSWYPYVKKIKEGKGSDPLILINSFESKKGREVVEGYKLNVKGELKLELKDVSRENIFGSGTSKAIAGGDVYALALSTCDGKIAKCADGGGDDGGSTTTSGTVAIRTIQIRDKKESWLNNAEIRFMKVTQGVINPSNFYTHCGTNAAYCNYSGDWLAQYNDREIRDGRVVTVNKYLGRNSGDIVLYGLFEHDNWPAPRNTYKRVINGADVFVEYRSYQTPYDHYAFTTYSGDRYGLRTRTSYSVDNRAIKYNFN